MAMTARAPRHDLDDRRIDSFLVMGGDERITLDPRTGLNRYGCGVEPEHNALALGSATCSTISSGAHDALVRLADRLEGEAPGADPYRIETRRIRAELARLCGLPAGGGVILAASGTDLCLIVGALVRDARRPLGNVMACAGETGRGVPSALSGLRFGDQTPLGGMASDGAVLRGAPEGHVLSIPLRDTDGRPRPPEQVDRDYEAACERAHAAGHKILLTLVDVSKTGIIAPSLDCAIHLKTRFGDDLDVLVDACQFRASPRTLGAYLQAGFLVAITGSKFVTGPAFSGALLVPPSARDRLAGRACAEGLRDYSCRDDWPSGWRGRCSLPKLANLGLMYRWEAALHELRAFRALPEDRIAGFLTAFADVVERGLRSTSSLEPAPVAALARAAPGAWDAIPTIFPFVAETCAADPLFRRLKAGHAGRVIHLGQPVVLGLRNGTPLSALRICASARLTVEALSGSGQAQAMLRRVEVAIETIEACAERPGP